MTDPFSLAASIISVTAIGFHVARKLYGIADDIGSAGKEVRVSADELSNFSRLLFNIKTEMERPPTLPPDQQNLLTQILDVCERCLKPLQVLEKTLEVLLVKFRDSPAKVRSLGLRIDFVFRHKKQLLYFRGLIHRQTSSLNTFLGLVNVQHNKFQSSALFQIAQMSLANSSDTMNRLLNEDYSNASTVHFPYTGLIQNRPESHDRTEGTGIQDESEQTMQSPQRSLGRADTMDTENEANGDLETINEDGATARDSPTNANEHDDRPAALTLYRPDQETEDELTTEEEEHIDSQIDQALQSTNRVFAVELWEDMRSTSRRILRVAAEVSQLRQEAGTDPDTAAPPLRLHQVKTTPPLPKMQMSPFQPLTQPVQRQIRIHNQHKPHLRQPISRLSSMRMPCPMTQSRLYSTTVKG